MFLAISQFVLLNYTFRSFKVLEAVQSISQNIHKYCKPVDFANMLYTLRLSATPTQSLISHASLVRLDHHNGNCLDPSGSADKSAKLATACLSALGLVPELADGWFRPCERHFAPYSYNAAN